LGRSPFSKVATHIKKKSEDDEKWREMCRNYQEKKELEAQRRRESMLARRAKAAKLEREAKEKRVAEQRQRLEQEKALKAQLENEKRQREQQAKLNQAAALPPSAGRIALMIKKHNENLKENKVTQVKHGETFVTNRSKIIANFKPTNRVSDPWRPGCDLKDALKKQFEGKNFEDLLLDTEGIFGYNPPQGHDLDPLFPGPPPRRGSSAIWTSTPATVNKSLPTTIENDSFENLAPN